MSQACADNPKAPDLNDRRAWAYLIEMSGPASMLVLIERRMGPNISRYHRPEDLWQETLLSAWRSRDSLKWNGQRAFRAWLVSVMEHRLRDLVDYEMAIKRGRNEQPRLFFSELAKSKSNGQAATGLDPMITTTPGRLAIHKEESEALKDALSKLPAEVQEIVQLRLIEQLPLGDIARQVDLGLEAVRYRFRMGSIQLRDLLRATLASRSSPGRNESRKKTR